MITKLELQEILDTLHECAILEIEFTSNRKSTFDSTPQGVCYYVKTQQCIDQSVLDKTIVMTKEIKVTETILIIKNEYIIQLSGDSKKSNLVTKIIPLDQINNLTIV